MVAAATSLVLLALLLPMMALIYRFAREDALATTSLEVQATESVVALRERADLVTFIGDLNSNDDDTRTTVLFADGDAIGPDQEMTAAVGRARESGRAISSDTGDGVEILVPVTLSNRTSVTGAVDPSESVAIIRVAVSDARFLPDVVTSWVIICLLGLALLGLAVFLADRLARSLVGSVTALAATAEQLEDGQLHARAVPSGPREIREVAQALNKLAGRITELLAHERESAADASHRLRTPLMALRLQAEELADPEERGRIGEGVDRLTRSVDGVINDFRRPSREGLGGLCDATAVVGARTHFWAPLAEDQDRHWSLDQPGRPLWVKLLPEDLEDAVDALLENVFAHTEEGTAFRVTLAPVPGGGGVLTVEDAGAGIPTTADRRGATRSGSTGLGLDIVRRAAERSGGSLEISNRAGGGSSVRLVLGAGEPNERRPQPPTDEPAGNRTPADHEGDAVARRLP
jgi:signal transduction histidine kinase